MNLLDGINDTEDELYTFDSIIETEVEDDALESLNKLKEYWLNHLPLSVKDGLRIVKVLEKEHKEYEEMKAIKGTTTFDKAIEDTLITACPDVAKKLKALEIIKGIFNIQVLGDYLIAQRGETFVVENLKLKQTQEIINLLKEVLE